MEIFLFILIAGLLTWFVTECVAVHHEDRREIKRPISRRALREIDHRDDDFWTGAP